MASRMTAAYREARLRLEILESQAKKAWHLSYQRKADRIAQKNIYVALRDEHAALALKNNLVVSAIAFYADLGDGDILPCLIRAGTKQGVLKALSERINLVSLRTEQKFELLKALVDLNISRKELGFDLGLTGAAIEADNPDLFSLGISWGEIAIHAQSKTNHHIIDAINNCRLRCRDPLAGLLREAVGDPELAQAVMSVTAAYQTQPVKALLVLDAFGFGLAEKQFQIIEDAIEAAGLSNHQRLLLVQRRKKPERMLLLHPTQLT